MNWVGSYCTGVYIRMNNIYPDWWNTTVTVYNKYENSAGEVTWYRTVLKGCFWKYVTHYQRIDNATQMTKVLICRVRKNSKFIENYLWRELADKSRRFTFSDGDILVKGEVDDTVDEYVAGSRSSDLLKKYKDRCVQISECTINTGEERTCEHYLVKGI